jgi:hypothetical protein
VNPYEVLGVTPGASMAEIEARYRLLLREYHPDLHHHEGADAVAFAEATTRNLNSAMDQLRRTLGSPGGTTPPGGWTGSSWTGGQRPRGERDGAGRDRQWRGQNPFWRPPADEPANDGDPLGSRANFYGAQDTEWFGEPITHAPDEPVPCPFCGRPYQRLDDYELHLERVHSYRRVAPKPPRRKSRLVLAMGKLRFLPVWLLVPIAFANWRMFGFYWFTWTLAFVALVLWTQTSSVFRD